MICWLMNMQYALARSENAPLRSRRGLLHALQVKVSRNAPDVFSKQPNKKCFAIARIVKS